MSLCLKKKRYLYTVLTNFKYIRFTIGKEPAKGVGIYGGL